MAYQIPGLIISLKSSGAVATQQFHGVFATSSIAAGGYAMVAARGGRVTGVLLGNSTEATDQAIQITGVAKIAAGDSSAMETAITEGLVLSMSSVGQAIPSTGGASEWKIGTALEPLATGSTGVISVLLGIYQSSS